MVLSFIDQLISTAMMAITQGSPLAVITLFFVVALTECGIPFPFVLDTVLFFTSYQADVHIGNILLVMFIVLMGRQFGAALIYWLTRMVGSAVIYWFSKRYKHLQHNWAQLTVRLSKDAPMAIALVRITGLMTLASAVAGAMHIRYVQFFLGVALSAAIFDGSLIVLGLITKYGFQFIGFTPSIWHVMVGIIILMTIVMVFTRFNPFKKSEKKNNKKDKTLGKKDTSLNSGDKGQPLNNIEVKK